MTPAPAFPVTELLVCTTCRPAGAAREALAAGTLLLEAVQDVQRVDVTGRWERVRVRGMACMSSCSRACSVAFQAHGKHSYLFGDLVPGGELATQVLDCARLHADAPDGTLIRSDRPEGLRNGILAKLPPPLEAVLT